MNNVTSMNRKILITLLFTLLMISGRSQQAARETPLSPFDLSHEPVLYTVGYAHLDTEWRWDYQETIGTFLKNTLDENFAMFEKYRPYIFTFTGARRYRMIRDYYPEQYARMKKYISAGRWNVGGSSVDECDVNVPAPESVIRQVLYGNGYFRSEFGKESVDFMLPDCFGFPASLPSTLAHAGLKGFSTQKLSWGSASGIPFNIGNWKGPDGKGIIAALNATDYNGRVAPRLDTVSYWWKRIMENGNKYGLFADYRYYGVGDVGGSPREDDIRNAVGSINQPYGKFKVYLTSSDQLFRDIKPEQASRLPEYSGDLLLTEHSAGSLTSQAYMKRWNRKNEQLALATEPLAVMADWLKGIRYPFPELNGAWWLVLGSQMHDILPGTSIPKAYEYAWNDEVLAMNRFASVMKASAGVAVRALDTRGIGQTVVVFNPLAIDRTDMAEATLHYPQGAPQEVVVVNPAGDSIPVQILEAGKNFIRFIFTADVPSLGFTCYDVRPAGNRRAYATDLTASAGSLENQFLKIVLNAGGDIAGITDKRQDRELLSGPARLEFLKEHPSHWPAWNMDWDDRKNPPIGYVDGAPSIILTENGPLRSTIRVERKARGSVFIQEITLESGSEQLKVKNRITWQSSGVCLKASFPLKARNDKATYNLGLGTIERNNNHPKKYEVPSREWIDLTDKSGRFGISLLEDSKFGSDKPNDTTLRLTLLFTPTTNSFHDQATQDWGIHDITYGIYSHRGDWRVGLTEWQGRRLNQPLVTFVAAQHPGVLGKQFSFASVSDRRVDIRAMKKSENGRDVIIRLQELTGNEISSLTVTMAGKIIRAWEVDGQERMTGELKAMGGKLSLTMEPYAIRSIAVQIEPFEDSFNEPASFELPLVFDQDVVSSDSNRTDGSFDGDRTAFPAEQLPSELTMNGIQFNLGSGEPGKNNVMVCRGQKIVLPKTGNYNYAYILASATRDTSGVFRVGNLRTTIRVSRYSGMIGQFDKRLWDKLDRISGVDQGYIRRDPVAWYCTHLHRDTSNTPYEYGYIYLYRLEASPVSNTIQLPDNSTIKIFAITLASNSFDHLEAAAPLYDDFSGRPEMTLQLPVSYVKEGLEQKVRTELHSKRNLSDLPVKLTMKDYADIHQPNGVMVDYYPEEGEKLRVGALIDGMYDLLPDDSAAESWTRSGQGRIVMDLQKEIEIDSLHLFFHQSLETGPQSFSLWSNTSPEADPKGDPNSKGWRCIGFIKPADIWGNNRAIYRIFPEKDQRISARQLMFMSENSPHGPFYFREIDIFEKQQ